MKRLLAAISFLLVFALSAEGYIRIQICSTPLAWSSWPVEFVIGDTSIVDDGAGTATSGFTVSEAQKSALRCSFTVWEDDGDSDIDFTEDTSSTSTARIDFLSTDIHLVLFDEDNSSGFFSSSGVVAVTPILFGSSGGCPTTGSILDADILLNDRDFNFSTHPAGESGRPDIANVITHEVGHFIGLDHTPIGNATMFPYVTNAEVSKRSLSTDDILGATVIQPPASTSKGSISGTVDEDGTAVKHPHVVALDSDGVVAGAVFGNLNGTYTIGNLSDDTYTVYALPFLSVLTTSDISETETVNTGFSATFHGDNDSPTGVAISGNDATGINIDAEDTFGSTTKFTGPTAFPGARIERSETQGVTLTGTALSGLTGESETRGGTKTITLTGSPSATSWTVSVTPGATEPFGAYDLRLYNGDTPVKMAVWPGAFEVVKPAPAITSLDVSVGSPAGGTTVVITGTDFDGDTTSLKVMFGGVLATVSAVTSTTVTVTTPAVDSTGQVDVDVINADGMGDRLADGFTYTSLSNFFPGAGNDAGGTTLTLNGAGFESGTTITIGGTAATNVSVVSATKITCTTPAGTAGTAPIVLSLPGGGTITASSSFLYSTLADPSISSITVSTGETTGGTSFALGGSGFVDGAVISFGADLDDGTGGSSATGVTFESSTSISGKTPAVAAAGAVDILLVNPNGQAASLASGFTYTAASGGGGGCCAITPVGGGPPSIEDVLGLMLPFFALFLVLLILRWRHAAAPLKI